MGTVTKTPWVAMMLEFRLVGLEGPIVPYVRMTQRSKHADPRARRYLASQQALKIQLRQQMTEKDEHEPLTRESLEVFLAFWWVNHRQDLDNLVKAILDAASGIVWADDRWVDHIEASREQRREQVCFLQVRRR